MTYQYGQGFEKDLKSLVDLVKKENTIDFDPTWLESEISKILKYNPQKISDATILKIFEIAFGESASPETLNHTIDASLRRESFSEEELIEKLEMYEKNSFKVEDLDESSGFSEGDTIKIMGRKYLIHIGNDDEMSLLPDDEK